MAKSAAQAMTLEDMPITKSKGLGRKTAIKAAEHLGTPTLIWVILTRHKLGILAFWAISLTVIQVFPFVPQLLLDLVTGL